MNNGMKLVVAAYVLGGAYCAHVGKVCYDLARSGSAPVMVEERRLQSDIENVEASLEAMSQNSPEIGAYQPASDEQIILQRARDNLLAEYESLAGTQEYMAATAANRTNLERFESMVDRTIKVCLGATAALAVATFSLLYRDSRDRRRSQLPE